LILKHNCQVLSIAIYSTLRGIAVVVLIRFVVHVVTPPLN